MSQLISAQLPALRLSPNKYVKIMKYEWLMIRVDIGFLPGSVRTIETPLDRDGKPVSYIETFNVKMMKFWRRRR